MGARPGARKQQRQPGRRSPAARAKTSRQHDQAGRCYLSFRGLLTHLATLTRNQVRFATATIATLAEPTSIQREAFDLTHTDHVERPRLAVPSGLGTLTLWSRVCICARSCVAGSRKPQ